MTTPTTVLVQLKLRSDTASNWTSANPTLLAGELGRETDTGKIKIGTGSTAWTALAYQPFGAPITNADISATAEIAVSKLADGTARQLLQTDAAGTGVEWASNIDIPGTLDVTGAATFDAAVTVTGDLTVNGTTTTISTQNLLVEDKNIIIGDVATPTDTTADGGGITLKGATDKTINWVDATDAWTSSERFSVPLGTVALPSLTFTGYANTGIYSPGAYQLAITTAGVERVDWGTTEVVFNDGGVNYDFRIEGDTNANLFFVDASTDRVGVGTSAPSTLLHLSSATGGSSPTPTELRIATTTSASNWSITDPWGRISFYNEDGSGAGPKIHASIDATALTTAGATSDIVFRTNNNLSNTLDARMVIKGDPSASGARVGIGTTNPGGALEIQAAATITPLIVQGPSSEFVRITSAGNVGIGTASPTSKLTVYETSTAAGAADILLVGTAGGGGFNIECSDLSAANPDWALRTFSNEAIVFKQDTNERARIDSSGRLLVGTGNAVAIGSFTPTLQNVGSSTQNSSIALSAFSTTAAIEPRLNFTKSATTTIGANALVADGESLGSIRFHGSQTAGYIQAATIECYVDGDPETAGDISDMPGRIVLKTTADGSQTPVERLRITNDGVIAHDQPAPAAVNATATLTVANLKAGIITSTSAAATDMTLPTGTDTQAGFSGTYDNFTFEWSVINTGPSLVRVLAGTAHTVVGSGSVATGTSGRFASRRTAANTFVSYRLS